MPTYLSKCCAAPVEVQGGVTQWWLCTRCQNPCDAVKDVRQTGYTAKHAAPALRCQHCEVDIYATNALTHGDWGDRVYEDADGISVCMKAEFQPGGKTEFVHHKPLPGKI